MSQGWNIAILGATGAVGRALIECLEQRQFAVGDLTLLATEESAGESIRFSGKNYQVKDAQSHDWSDNQLAFFVAGQQASAQYADLAADAGCIVIDSSGLFALAHDVPLAVVGVNESTLADYRNRNIIAVADSQVSQLINAIAPLNDEAGVQSIQLTEFLSVSAQGKAAVDALAGESARLLNGIPPEQYHFGRQLAFNMMPLAVDEQGSVPAERRVVDQVRKILQDESFALSVTSLQAPIFYGNAQSVRVMTARPLDVEEAQHLLAARADVTVSDEQDFPTPVSEGTGQDQLYIGAIRQDYGQAEGLQFWSVADNVRYGGALMAVKIAESLVEDYL
ncbi:aspartate-semialdehyde dehydrogenase [Tatumella sp. TA1]|uniref:aspartate-semialdehyde dehydrogenase n=1 Tax=Rosenbergiella collisarenosi TaxID=1544695 RepID=UPI0008F8278C|nr:aspartate-semialdehyde dehydrogenase [Rosenbergiella collisarenosi]MBT0720501.1 aspartate-semialdehyde dehydrogenase [Rosenbergiella collisarenosi]QGX91862.1 aspartate-semialdehyde dehydrogenase [Tatumella sp. TA1]